MPGFPFPRQHRWNVETSDQEHHHTNFILVINAPYSRGSNKGMHGPLLRVGRDDGEKNVWFYREPNLGSSASNPVTILADLHRIFLKWCVLNKLSYFYIGTSRSCARTCDKDLVPDHWKRVTFCETVFSALVTIKRRRKWNTWAA